MFDQSIRDRDIAVISMTGRFPGAPTVEQLWENLKGGVESFTEITPEDIKRAGYHGVLASHPDYVWRRPVLDDIRGFDAAFFGYSPREASVTDPQHRIFLECVWEALEQAGYGRAGDRGRVGLFAGDNISMYMHDRFNDPEVLLRVDPYEMVIGNDKDALTTAIAYRLDLTGPAVTVQSFCSTSAVAIHLACQSLRLGECEMALAGGVCIRVPDRIGYVFVEGGMGSPDGKIRTFDAKAKGGVFGDGSAVVLLKPLRQALADRDTVLAVIRGSAMNNDGAAKFSYTAPSVVGQATAVAAALADADVAPRDISYVEAHGTATELGDPIEVTALTRAFGNAELARSGKQLRDRQYCAIGSVKTNVGHLDRAATVTGLIKVVEALRHELIPESLNYETPNPEINFDRSPFYVAGSPIPWPKQTGRPRLAGVNGLGMGGTNVHIVLQEAPDPAPRPASSRLWQVLPLSAQSAEAADAYCEKLAAHLAASPDQDLGDTAYTLAAGRALLAHRRVAIADSSQSAAEAFAKRPDPGATLLSRHEAVKERRSAFLLGGVGEHFAGMVAELYRTEPTFRRHLNHGQQLLTEVSSIDVVTPLTAVAPASQAGAAGADLASMLGRRGGSGDGGADDSVAAAGGPLSDTVIAQPAVFLAEYALAQTLQDWGILPDLVLGYSVGEYVAACLAGVLTLPDAIALVARRAEFIGALPAGSMLAIGRTWNELTAIIPDLAARGIDLAAVNPGQIVIGGPPGAITELAAELRAAGVVSRALDTSHAFHTAMLEPAAAELTSWIAANVQLSAPKIAYVSNVTGDLITEQEATDPAYWARHMCQPVRFADGLATALSKSSHAIIEVAPGKSLGAMTRSHPACDRTRWPLIVATLPGAGEEGTHSARSLAQALGELWLTGVDVDWNAYHRSGDWVPGRVPLPTYPFQRQEYWFRLKSLPDLPGVGLVKPDAIAPATESTAPTKEDLVSEYDTLPLLPESQWLNLTVWRERTPRPAMGEPGTHWVLFAGDDDASSAIAGSLRDELLAVGDRTVTVVRPGLDFSAGPDGYRIRPGDIEDMLDLFTDLRRGGIVPDRIVHLWTLGPAEPEQTIRLGMSTLVAIARSAHEVGFGDFKLDVVTAGVFTVVGDEAIIAARATVTGPCTILPVEYPGASIRVIDLVDGLAPPVPQLLAELRSDPANQVLALRGGRRWTPDFEILELAEAAQQAPAADSPFRENGVYLITGGLGGVGLALAQRIAANHRGRLVLMGRTPVPPRPQWESILADPGASAEVRRRIEGLLRLEELGSQVEVVAGDVAVLDDVRRTLRAARDRFGPVDGVLHAAGVPGMGMMQFKTIDDMDRVLAPKVAGTLALAQALAEDDQQPDFLVLFSSVAAWTGALGQADYSAANAFLDAFARADAMPGTKVSSIGWGEWVWNGWTEGLEGYEPVLREFYVHHRKRFGIGFDEGWRCMLHCLARSEPNIVVNTQDFAASVAGSRTYTIRDVQEGARKGRGDSRHARPDLSTPFLAPSSDAEIAIAEIWGEWLGIDQVGIMDNFFDLGGSSIVGVGIVDAVRRALELEHLPPHLLYQAPTVAMLAAAALERSGAGQARAGQGPAAGARDPGVPELAAQVENRAGRRQQMLARRRASMLGEAGDE